MEQAIDLRDEFFRVIEGELDRPRAAKEAHLMVIEPTGTPNSGDVATAPRRVI